MMSDGSNLATHVVLQLAGAVISCYKEADTPLCHTRGLLCFIEQEGAYPGKQVDQPTRPLVIMFLDRDEAVLLDGLGFILGGYTDHRPRDAATVVLDTFDLPHTRRLSIGSLQYKNRMS